MGGGRVENVYKTLVAVVGAIGSYLFGGGWPALLGVLLAFIIADYITGIMAAGAEGKLSSSVGFKGISRINIATR